MKPENIELMMGSVEFLMTSFDHIIYYMLNFIFDTMPEP